MIEVPLWTEHTTENRPTDQHGESEKSAERGKKNREHNITESDPGSEKNNRSERTRQITIRRRRGHNSHAEHDRGSDRGRGQNLALRSQLFFSRLFLSQCALLSFRPPDENKSCTPTKTAAAEDLGRIGLNLWRSRRVAQMEDASARAEGRTGL